MRVVLYWYDVIFSGKLLSRSYSAIFLLGHPLHFLVSEQLGSIRLTTSWRNIRCIFILLLTASNFHTAANSYSFCFLPSIALYIWSLTRTETHTSTQCYKPFVWEIFAVNDFRIGRDFSETGCGNWSGWDCLILGYNGRFCKADFSGTFHNKHQFAVRWRLFWGIGLALCRKDVWSWLQKISQVRHTYSVIICMGRSSYCAVVTEAVLWEIHAHWDYDAVFSLEVLQKKKTTKCCKRNDHAR